jgi:hypothetical protein
LVAAGSLLPGYCCKTDELLAGHGGEGEWSLSGLSCCRCSCLSTLLKPSIMSCHGGGEDFADSGVAQEGLPQLLPTGCYGSMILCAEHIASVFDAMILGRYGDPSSTSNVEASLSLLRRKLDGARLPSGLVPGGLTTAVGRRFTSEGSLRAACSRSSAETPGERRRLVAETPRSLIEFSKISVGCFL